MHGKKKGGQPGKPQDGTKHDASFLSGPTVTSLPYCGLWRKRMAEAWTPPGVERRNIWLRCQRWRTISIRRKLPSLWPVSRQRHQRGLTLSGGDLEACEPIGPIGEASFRPLPSRAPQCQGSPSSPFVPIRQPGSLCPPLPSLRSHRNRRCPRELAPRSNGLLPGRRTPRR